MYCDEVADELCKYVLSIGVKSKGKNGPVLVAGHAATSVPVCKYKYCNPIM